MGHAPHIESVAGQSHWTEASGTQFQLGLQQILCQVFGTWTILSGTFSASPSFLPSRLSVVTASRVYHTSGELFKL
jgi:hypothetical protein